MLVIHNEFTGGAAQYYGANVNDFLTALLTEVVTENYRQAVAEELILARDQHVQGRDIALRANERCVTGLFATGLNRVGQLARPEVSIPRSGGGNGKLDFLIWFGGRAIGLELKAGSIRYHNEAPRKDTVERWQGADQQVKDAQIALRQLASTDAKFFKPISIALMVVPGTSAKPMFEHHDLDARTDFRERFLSHLRSFRPTPQYIATYDIPEELSVSVRRKSGKLVDGKSTHTPFFGFIARVRVQGKEASA